MLSPPPVRPCEADDRSFVFFLAGVDSSAAWAAFNVGMRVRTGRSMFDMVDRHALWARSRVVSAQNKMRIDFDYATIVQPAGITYLRCADVPPRPN